MIPRSAPKKVRPLKLRAVQVTGRTGRKEIELSAKEGAAPAVRARSAAAATKNFDIRTPCLQLNWLLEEALGRGSMGEEGLTMGKVPRNWVRCLLIEPTMKSKSFLISLGLNT
jgi:hypothetical protein